jgi:hypothetical protein
MYIKGKLRMKTTKTAMKTAPALAFVSDADFKIEDGIPMPTSARPARPAKYFPFEKLTSGQSFLVSKDRKKGLRPALARYYAANPAQRKTIAIRKVENDAVRVWRK